MTKLEKPNKRNSVPEVRLVYRTPRSKASDRPQVNTSASAYMCFRPYFEECMETYETFMILLLDRGNRCKGVARISEGGLHGTVVDPKLVFGFATRTLSCGIILAHNHPSGQLKASQQDLDLTQNLISGGRLLDIEVHDHLILTRTGYLSWSDEGWI